MIFGPARRCAERRDVKPSKQIFLTVFDAVSTLGKAHGFGPHPLYPTGWEPANQAYQGSLICPYVADQVDQFEVALYPAGRTFRFDIIRSANSFGLTGLADLPADAGDWTDMWLHRPYTQYHLKAGKIWHPFAVGRPFRLKPQDLIDVDKAVGKIMKAFAANAQYLFDALHGDYRGRLVNVIRYDVTPPE